MKITCIQMDMAFCRPEENFLRVSELIQKAAENQPDVIVLPETWNTGFYPKENAEILADPEGTQTKALLGALAAKYRVNTIAGSITELRNGKLYNTCYVFDREGMPIASYDKTHLFSPMGENQIYTAGDHLCCFTLDGIRCGMIICYDLRFPELTRKLCLQGVDVLFVVSQWPAVRISHLRTLTAARAIENQVFVACCNSCGKAGDTVYGGNSVILDPLGEPLALAGSSEQLLTAECDLSSLSQIRNMIPVFQDRRVDLYLTKN